MHINEFRQLQQDGASFNQFQLIMACRRKFLNAANLLELHSPMLEKLNSFSVDAPIDIHPLLDPFSILAERYIEEYFSPQKNLFPALEQEQDVKWGHYYHQVLMPHLLANDDIVRNVLRAVRAIPSKKPQEAVIALKQHFIEMTFPEMPPPWAPENIFNY